MANTTVRDSGNNVITFKTFDTGAGLLAGVVLADPTGNTALTLNVTLPPDQDPNFDHANAVRLSLTANTSTSLITPPANCKYIRITSDNDTFVNTANTAAGDIATSIKIFANSPEVLPVTAAVPVFVYSANASIVRATPLKAR